MSNFTFSIRGLKVWFYLLYFGTLVLALFAGLVEWSERPVWAAIRLLAVAAGLIQIVTSGRKKTEAYIKGELNDTSFYTVDFIVLPLLLVASPAFFEGIWLAVGYSAWFLLGAGFLLLHLVVKRRRGTALT